MASGTESDHVAREGDAPVVVVGAGLAGSEAAWQLAERGVSVRLYEMKPERSRRPSVARFRRARLQQLPAREHPRQRRRPAEGGDAAARFAGAGVSRTRRAVPAGRALAVDRIDFSRGITDGDRGASAHRDPARARDEDSRRRERRAGHGSAHRARARRDLQDCSARSISTSTTRSRPTVYADSIDHDVVFRASRYDEGDDEAGDYLNVPLSRDEYEAFVDALLAAETVPLHEFEAAMYFEGCLPIEEMARRGPQTLAYGPMKPVGLVDPRTGHRPHAVVQLRQEDKAGTLYNLVGFQTKLRVGEQQRLFRSLPGLGEAVFARFGSMHRNTYVNAPIQLDEPRTEGRARALPRRTDGGRRGLRRIRGARISRRDGRGAGRARRSTRRRAGGDGTRGAAPPSPERGREAFPADERELRALPAPRSRRAPRRRRKRRRKLKKRDKNQLLAERALRSLEPTASARVSEARAG